MLSEQASWASEEILSWARALDLGVEADPPEFRHRSPMIASWTQAEEDTSPPAGVALRLDYYHLVVGDLGADPEYVEEALAGLLDRVVVAKSWLKQNRRDDVYLLAVGPPGSKDMPEWAGVPYGIEKDDRVCRRHVWLPPADRETWQDSLTEDVLQRSFMARPWTRARKGIDSEAPDMLDPVTAVQQAIVEKGREKGRGQRKGGDERAERVARWMAILADADPSKDDEWRAKRLVATYDGKEVGA